MVNLTKLLSGLGREEEMLRFIVLHPLTITFNASSPPIRNYYSSTCIPNSKLASHLPIIFLPWYLMAPEKKKKMKNKQQL